MLRVSVSYERSWAIIVPSPFLIALVIVVVLASVASATVPLPPELPPLPEPVSLRVKACPCRPGEACECGPGCTCHPAPAAKPPIKPDFWRSQSMLPPEEFWPAVRQTAVSTKLGGHWELRGCSTGQCRRVWVEDKQAAVKQATPAPKAGQHSHKCSACGYVWSHYPGGSHTCAACGQRGNYAQYGGTSKSSGRRWRLFR